MKRASRPRDTRSGAFARPRPRAVSWPRTHERWGRIGRARGRANAVKWKMLALATGVGALYALGALSTIWLFSDYAPGTVFFPSAGLTVAALLLTPRRWWPVILVAVATAEITVDLSQGQTTVMALGFALANVVEPV